MHLDGAYTTRHVAHKKYPPYGYLYSYLKYTSIYFVTNNKRYIKYKMYNYGNGSVFVLLWMAYVAKT